MNDITIDDDDDDWDCDTLQQLCKAEEDAIAKLSSNPSSSSTPTTTFPSHSHLPPQPQRPPTSLFNSTITDDPFAPPPELSQRSIQFPPPPNPNSDKDLEIERLKKELGHAFKQISDLEKEHLKLKKERDRKEERSKFISSKNEEEIARIKCSKSIDKDFGIRASDHHKISTRFQNGESSNDLTVETTDKAKGVETETVSHQETRGPSSDDRLAYLDLSQKLLAVWGSPTDKKLKSDVISKFLVGCQRDFHVLFSCMSTTPPSEITRKFTDVSSSGKSLHNVKGCVNTPEEAEAKVSHLYHAFTKVADETHVLETLIAPLLDLCGMENVVIVHSSLCILHTLLKLLLETEKNFGRSALCSGTMSSLKEIALGSTLWIMMDLKV